MQHNPFTELAGQETKLVEGHKVDIKAFILPHISRISADELERAGGKERLRDTQGFYVYRNRRLITWGTWFRLLGRDELTRLARIQIDIPNALDDLWGLDVKKSTASPPEAVRQVLKQIIHTVADKSTNVFQERRRRKPSGNIIYLWERALVRGGVRYNINRYHPLLTTLAEALGSAQAPQLDRVLDALEMALPVRAIYVDQASNESVDQGDSELEGRLRDILRDLLRDVPTNSRRRFILEGLTHIEPFSTFPKTALALIAEFD